MAQYYIDKNGLIHIPKTEPKKEITILEYIHSVIKNLKQKTLTERTTELANEILYDFQEGCLGEYGWTLDKIITTISNLSKNLNK